MTRARTLQHRRSRREWRAWLRGQARDVQLRDVHYVALGALLAAAAVVLLVVLQ